MGNRKDLVHIFHKEKQSSQEVLKNCLMKLSCGNVEPENKGYAELVLAGGTVVEQWTVLGEFKISLIWLWVWLGKERRIRTKCVREIKSF